MQSTKRVRWAVLLALVGCGDNSAGGASATGTGSTGSTGGSTGDTTAVATTETPTTDATTSTGGSMTGSTGEPTTTSPATTDATTDATSTGAVMSTGAPMGVCGDGVLDPGEACDAAALGGESCESQGFDGGALACDPACMFDTTGCTKCGDGALDPGEACDDGNNTPGDGCDAACKIEMCDPNGVYQVQGAPIGYTCCNGLVTVNINSFTLANAGATITSSPSNPVPMLGAATTCPAGKFANQGSIPGGCTETYKVSGKFTDNNTWTGTYDLVFTGNQCSCFQGMLGTPCVNQSFPVTAKR